MGEAMNTHDVVKVDSNSSMLLISYIRKPKHEGAEDDGGNYNDCIMHKETHLSMTCGCGGSFYLCLGMYKKLLQNPEWRKCEPGEKPSRVAKTNPIDLYWCATCRHELNRDGAPIGGSCPRPVHATIVDCNQCLVKV